MKFFKKLTALFVLVAATLALTVAVSASGEYTVSGITLSERQYKAYEAAVSEAEAVGMTVDHAVFAKAAATVEYAGLQARRRADGKTGIRSLYTVNQTFASQLEAAGYEISYGAMMGIAEYYGESYDNAPDGMMVTLDADMVASINSERAATITVYATSGKQDGIFLDATQTSYAFTTIYGGEYENFLPYTQIGMVYRGFLALRDASGNTAVFYYDGIGDTFGNDCMYGVATSAMDLYSYYTTYEGYGEDTAMLEVSECAKQTIYVTADAVGGGKGTETEPFALGEALSQVESIMTSNSFSKHVEFELLLSAGKYILTEEAELDGSAFAGKDYSVSIVGAGDGKTVITSAIDIAPVNGVYNLPGEYIEDGSYPALRSMLADGKMMNMATSAEYVMQYDAAKFTDTVFNTAGKIESAGTTPVAEEDEVLYLDAALLESLAVSQVDGTKHYIPGTEIWIKVEWQVQAVVLDYYDTSKTMTALDGTTTLYAAHVRHDNWTRLLNTNGSGRNYYSTLAGRGYTLRNNAGLLTENTFTYDRSSGQFHVMAVDGVSYSVPVLTRLLDFKNAKNITVTGIDFTGTTDTFTSQYGYVSGQTGYQKVIPSEMASEFSLSTFLPYAAVYGLHVENFKVDGCRFYDLTVDGVQLRGAVNGAAVTNNSFVDIGSSAIRIGNNAPYNVKNKRYAKDITVEQNYVERTGTRYPSSVAVAIYPVSNLKLNYNSLIDSAYSAISVGWSWSATNVEYPTVVNVTDAEIAYNSIIGFMVSGMKDGGAIYVLGGNATAEEQRLFNSIHHNYCEVTADTSRAAGGKSGTFTVLYHDGSASHWHTHHNVVYTLHDTNPTKYSYISYQSIVGSQTYNCFSEDNYFINLKDEWRIFYGGLKEADLYNLRAEGNLLVENAHEAYAMIEPHKIVTGAGCDGHKATYPVDCAHGKHVYLRKAVLPNGENLAYPATTKTAAQYYALCYGCNAFLSGTDAYLLFAVGTPLTGSTHTCVYTNIVKEEYRASEATCSAYLTYYKSCADCGVAGTETFEAGAKLAHVWNNTEKKCSVCGEGQYTNVTLSENGREIIVTTGITETVDTITVRVPCEKLHYSGLYLINFDWKLSDLQNNYVEVVSPNSFMMVNRDKGANGSGYSTYGFYAYLEAGKNNDITINVMNGARITACNKVRFRFIETIASSLDTGTNTVRELGDNNAAGISDAKINVPKAGKYELVVFGGSPDNITMNISINGGTATSLTERPTDTKYYYTALSKTYAKNYKLMGFIPMGDQPHTGTSGFYYMSLGSFNFNAGENTVSVRVTAGRWCPASKIGNPPAYIFLVSSDAETHTYTDWVLENSHTCEQGSTMTRTCTCSECNGKAETVTLPAPGHDYGVWHDIFGESCALGHIRYRVCRDCGATEYEKTDAALHDSGSFLDTMLPGDANLKTPADCYHAAVYYKVCAQCGTPEQSMTFTVGEPLGHDFSGDETVKDGTVYATCVNGCGEMSALLSVPHAAVPDFFVDISDFNGKFTVPADKIWESGYYWVTLTGTTGASSGYTYMYNETAARVLLGENATASEVTAYAKLIASKNRDDASKNITNAGSPDGFLYSVYLVAGMDNVVTYGGKTATRARFSFAAPVSDDAVWFTSGKDDLAANTVAEAGFKDGFFYQLRSGSVLEYVKTIKITTDGYYVISANIFSTADTGSICFTFTEKGGEIYSSTISGGAIKKAIGDRTLYNGASGAVYFAPNLAVVYLPQGEYTFTLSQKDIAGMMIGAILVSELEHVCRPYVSYNVAPTCTTDGLTGEGCPICAKGATVVPAFGHTWGDIVPTTDATCTEAGVGTQTCDVCGETENVVIEAKGHEWSETETVIPASCTEAEIRYTECTVCGEKTNERSVGDPLGHTWGDYAPNNSGKHSRSCSTCGETETANCEYSAVVVAATCQNKGVTTYTCEICSHTYTEETAVDPNNHEWTEKTIKEPTCTSNGIGKFVCVCGANNGYYVMTANHSWSETETVIPATCTEAEIRYTECTVCGEKTNERSVGDALGHAWGEVETVTDATCTENGVGNRTCGACGTTVHVVIPATGHSFGDDGVCDDCGHVDGEESDVGDEEIDIGDL